MIDVKLVNESSKAIPSEVIDMVMKRDDFSYNEIVEELDSWNLKVKSVQITCDRENNNKTYMEIVIGDR